MRRSALAMVVLLAGLLATACGSSAKQTSTRIKSRTPTTAASSSTASSGKLTVTTATIKHYGSVLVAENGHALYIFAPDEAKKMTCTGACTRIWPPLKLPRGAKLVASGQVKEALLGSDPDPRGGRVVTYDGWPLYAYVTDTTAGVAHGQGIGLNGGLWYLISPSGKVITKRVLPSASNSGGY